MLSTVVRWPISEVMLTRRAFLLLAFASTGAAPSLGRTDPVMRTTAYQVNADVLYGLLSFTMTGLLDEDVDQTAEIYHVQLVGEGAGIRNRFASTGIIQKGRFTPTSTLVRLSIRGRQHETRITYDYDRRAVEYYHRSETFLLGRLRTGQNTFGIPEGESLDDFASIILNHGSGMFETEGKIYRTLIVRRARRKGEGVDEVQAEGYRGEIVPLNVSFVRNVETLGTVSRIDFSELSTWAKATDPARFTFARDRRIERIDARLILGTRIQVTFQSR
jgi:hypothetical protein